VIAEALRDSAILKAGGVVRPSTPLPRPIQDITKPNMACFSPFGAFLKVRVSVRIPHRTLLSLSSIAEWMKVRHQKPVIPGIPDLLTL
jgi:hypothetical protein